MWLRALGVWFSWYHGRGAVSRQPQFIARHFPFPADKQTLIQKSHFSSAYEMLIKHKCESHQGQRAVEIINFHFQHFSCLVQWWSRWVLQHHSFLPFKWRCGCCWTHQLLWGFNFWESPWGHTGTHKKMEKRVKSWSWVQLLLQCTLAAREPAKALH